ncbi:hypothetical protein DPMN_134612 [Dreissena polymorpha]|uniref:Uncharacterized protein n=1 Tax=Dreissena polymorpha TaxID=45954 RepID=A0A9D4G086_DREPO|nr:hypothetical protein DPMN_134612 [Dreissena polymorpha]
MPPTLWAHQTEVYNISFETDVKDKLMDGQWMDKCIAKCLQLYGPIKQKYTT